MRDNLRQYRARRDALPQGYPGEPTGRRARHLATLAAFISGIVASKSTQLPTVASHVPDGTKPEGRVKRLVRWVDNDTITEDVYFLSGKGLARCLGHGPARFQPLPIGMAREVFPQAARPAGFIRRVMGRCGTDRGFHWYALY